MTRYLLDTNVCVHFMRGREWARLAFSKLQPPDMAVSAVTVGELYEGIHRAETPSRELKKVETFLEPFEVIPFDRPEAMEWAKIEAALRKQGNSIEAEDAMIAATAKANGFTVVTGNLKHLGRIKGLKLVNWETHPPK